MTSYGSLQAEFAEMKTRLQDLEREQEITEERQLQEERDVTENIDMVLKVRNV